MFTMQEVIARERGNDLRRGAAERRLAQQVASVALWARIAAIVTARQARAQGRFGDYLNGGPVTGNPVTIEPITGGPVRVSA